MFYATRRRGHKAWAALFLSLAAAGSVSAQSTISSGEAVTGSVSNTSINTYSFNVNAGQSIFLSIGQSGTVVHDFQVSVNNPSGVAEINSFAGTNYNAYYAGAATGGSYTLNVGVWGGSGTVSYSAVIVVAYGLYDLAPGRAGGAMTPFQSYSSSITRGDLDIFTFDAVPGTVTYTFTCASCTVDTAFDLFEPNNARLTGNYGTNYTGSFKISTAGTYMMLIHRWGTADGTTPYTVSLSGTGIILPEEGKPDGAFCPVGCSGEGRAVAAPAVMASTTASRGNGGAGAGEPINIASGALYEPVLDYTTIGPTPLAFIRYYNSQSNLRNLYPTALGPNWRSNYDRYLRLPSATQARAERPDGQIVNFNLVSSMWTPDTDEDYTLTNAGATWTLTGPDDTVETYTATTITGYGSVGILNSIKLRDGYTQTLAYMSSQLTSVSDSYSRTLTLSYTGTELTGLTTPDTIAFTYGYTAIAGQNLLTSVGYNTTPASSIAYLYENAALPFALTGITDELGQRYATWAYDGVGRVTLNYRGDSTLSAGLTTVSYDDTTGNRTVTGPLGEQDTYKFMTLQGVSKVTEIDRAANGSVAAATRTFGYDSNGFLNDTRDWDGNETQYTNNNHGLPTKIVEAYGSTISRETDVAYDTTWTRLPHLVTTPSLTTTNVYDSNIGTLLTRTDTDTTTTSTPYSTNGQARTWTWTYTATGQPRTLQLPRTDVVARTTWTWTGGTLTSIVDALAHTTTINTSTGGGLPLTITDPNSTAITLSYDGRLNLHTKVVTISGGSLTTTWTHDAANNLTQVTQPDGTYLIYGYDDAHRLNKVTNANGEQMPLTLDAAGDVTKILWETSTGRSRREHDATFDLVGRKLTDVGGLGSSQTTTYGWDSQGNLTSIQTPLTWTTHQTPDALNRIQTIIDPSSNTIVTTYDAHDRPLAVKDPNGFTTAYVYDGFGDAIEVSSPDTGNTIYSYDMDGNVSQKTDAAGQVTNWTYDALDRPLTRAYPADGTLNVSYRYDQASHGKGITKLTSLTDQVGSLSLAYDETGNVLTNARTISSVTYTTKYTYNGQRTITTITYPTAAWKATYRRDSAGQVTGITTTQPGHAAVALVSSVTHLPFGPVNALAWGNGVRRSTTFDNDYRQTNLTDTGSAALQNLTYGFDADNNVHTITDAITAANSQTLTYDRLERLTGAVSGAGGYGTLSYGYDNNGNRTSDTGTIYTISPASNHVTAIGSTKVSYFGTGNINAIGSARMGYNKANQLSSASASGSSATYKYDAFGQRLTVAPPSYPVQVYNYDLAGKMLTETDNSIEFDYVYLDGMPIAVIEPSTAVISYIHPDRLGTPQLATNSSQASVWSVLYKPFGGQTPTGSITQNLRFPGQYADNTGFMHNGFRDYNPAIGRYLESDPIGLAAGTNTYAYVGNNPARSRDRFGLEGMEADQDDESSQDNVGDFGDQVNDLLQAIQEQQGQAQIERILKGGSYQIIPYDLTPQEMQLLQASMPAQTGPKCSTQAPNGISNGQAFTAPPDWTIEIGPAPIDLLGGDKEQRIFKIIDIKRNYNYTY